MVVLAGLAWQAGAAASQPSARPEVGASVPATATYTNLGVAQNSPMLAIDPTDSRFVALAHRQDAPEFGCGLQVSGDGGQGFVPAEPVPVLPEGAERCYGPEVAFDRHGRLYYLFIGLAGAGNNPVGVYLTTSTDHGRTFSPPAQVLGPSSYQVRMVIDNDRGRRGRLHLVWLQAANDDPLGGLPPLPNPLMSAYSDDGGATFSEPVQLSDADRPRAVAPAIAVGTDGRAHVAYFDLQDDFRDYQGLEGPAWEGTWSVVVTTSADGGRSWGPGVEVDDGLVPPGRVILIYTMAPPSLVAGDDGSLVAAWSDARNGDADVFTSRSADQGATWSPPLRVNDDPPRPEPADQYLPRLSVAPGGRVDLVYFDRRNDPANVRNDVYYSWSDDGGQAWAPSLRLTEHSSDTRVGQRYAVPSATGLFEIGSRLGLVSTRARALAAWPDTRNSLLGSADQSVFTAEARFPGVIDEPEVEGPPWLLIGAISGGATSVLVMIVVAVHRRRSQTAPAVVTSAK